MKKDKMPVDWIRRRLRRLLTRHSRKDIELLVTLWPEFEHFHDFTSDSRLSGIRVNPAAIPVHELKASFTNLTVTGAKVPLYYDVKGRQLRVEDAREINGHIELLLNHPINLDLRSDEARHVIFKAGADFGSIDRIEVGGRKLVFRDGRTYGPEFQVSPGESIHILHPSLQVFGELFTVEEKEKIDAALKTGFLKFFLSYVEGQRDVDELREIVGKDKEVWLKIENEAGMKFVRNDFKKTDGTVLVAARGDLYIELDRPHKICDALRTIIEKDKEACVGSRILLSVVQRTLPPEDKKRALAAVSQILTDGYPSTDALRRLIVRIHSDPVPSCADFSEIAWLLDIGYKRFLLCDELCLDGELLDTAMNAFDAFRMEYKT